MNNKNKKILDCIFTDPISSKILWKDIENLLIALNANISEGRGSRVRIELNNVLATFHRPHPEPETNKGAVKSMRQFLINAGINKNSFI